MTSEEAIRIAQGLITDFKCESETMVEFCNVVIKALKQNPAYASELAQKAYEDGKKDGYVQAKVEQEPKIGHWILWNVSSYDYTYKCDRCKNIVRRKSNYCPNCGTMMKEGVE